MRKMDIHDYREIFPNGTVVTHILGGRGKIKTLENDWDVDGDTPTVMALIHPLNTTFPNIRRIPVTELILVNELSSEVLNKWGKEALSFKKDIEDMDGAEPTLELISRLLSVILELQSKL